MSLKNRWEFEKSFKQIVSFHFTNYDLGSFGWLLFTCRWIFREKLLHFSEGIFLRTSESIQLAQVEFSFFFLFSISFLCMSEMFQVFLSNFCRIKKYSHSKIWNVLFFFASFVAVCFLFPIFFFSWINKIGKNVNTKNKKSKTIL